MKKIILIIITIVIVLGIGYGLGTMVSSKKNTVITSEVNSIDKIENSTLSTETKLFETIESSATVTGESTEEVAGNILDLPDFDKIVPKVENGFMFDVASSDTYPNLLMMNKLEKDTFKVKSENHVISDAFYNKNNIGANIFVDGNTYLNLVNTEDLSNDVGIQGMDFTAYDKHLVFKTENNTFYIIVTQTNDEITAFLIEIGGFLSNENIEQNAMSVIKTSNFKSALETRNITNAYNNTLSKEKPLLEMTYNRNGTYGRTYGFVNEDKNHLYSYYFYDISSDDSIIKLTASMVVIIDSLYFD